MQVSGRLSGKIPKNEPEKQTSLFVLEQSSLMFVGVLLN